MKGLTGLLMALVFALGVPALSQAQLFPVSADVATVRADLLLWAAALIGVALAIYAFKRVTAIVGWVRPIGGRLAAACLLSRSTDSMRR